MDYTQPSFHTVLMMDAYAAAVSPQATVKGFFCTALFREAASHGHHLTGYGPYRDFKDYPQLEMIRAIAEVARRIYPDQPVREAIRRVGWTVFPTMLETMVGKVVFGAVGHDMQAVMRMAPRGFEVSLRHGQAEVTRLSATEAELRVRDCCLFPDCFLVGVIEGAFAHYGKEAQVMIRNPATSSCEFLVRW